MLEVLVTSFGGVGTSPFLTWLNSRKSTNCARDSDGLKHLISPEHCKVEFDKSIFIFGDPIEALISLYSRDYIWAQMRKLTGSSFKLSIDEYAETGKDLIGYEKQFDKWLINSGTLFLKYPHFWEHEDKLLSFLSLDKSDSLFRKKERASKKADLSPSTLKRLEDIYAPLYNKFEEVGSYYIS